MSQKSGKVHVSVAHRYADGQWSRERNLAVYGDSASLEGLGNNLEVSWTSDADLAGRVKSLLDHRCLFRDESRFLIRASTLERIAQWLAEELNCRITVTEADRLRCSAQPGSDVVQIEIHVRNLWLALERRVDAETGLALSRQEIPRLVDEVFKEFSSRVGEQEEAWGRSLFATLARRLPGLLWVTVDLGRQRVLRLAPDPSRPG